MRRTITQLGIEYHIRRTGLTPRGACLYRISLLLRMNSIFAMRRDSSRISILDTPPSSIPNPRHLKRLREGLLVRRGHDWKGSLREGFSRGASGRGRGEGTDCWIWIFKLSNSATGRHTTGAVPLQWLVMEICSLVLSIAVTHIALGSCTLGRGVNFSEVDTNFC